MMNYENLIEDVCKKFNEVRVLCEKEFERGGLDSNSGPHTVPYCI